MPLVVPNGSSIFPSEAWWQAFANSITADINAVRGDALGAPVLTAGTNLDTLTASSTYTVWQSGYGNMPPDAGTGVLRTWWITETSGLQVWYGYGSAGAVFMRYRGSGGWSAWKRIDADYAVAQAKAYTDTAVQGARGGSGSGTKLVPLALTVGGSAAASGLGAVGVRMPMQWGARVTRWRVHVRNINPRFGTNQPGAVSLTGLWFGAGDGSGNFSGAATSISGAVSTPADGTEWVSKWVTTPLEAGTRYLLAYGLITTGTQSVVGGGWTVPTAADATNNAATKTARTSLPLDVWIEAETAATTPVIAAWGDSLSSGVGATTPVYDSVVSQYARANGALPVHYTASGDSAANWASNLTAYKWTRWATLAKPDVVIAAMGSNDVFGSDSLATVQANWQAAVDNIRATISPAVVVTTITPRDGDTANESKRRSFNTWLKGLPRGRDVFDFVPAVSSDDETLTPALTSDGTHLTTAGYAAEVATITRALAVTPGKGEQGPEGPPGPPGGSDSATASWINAGPLTQAAGDARWARTAPTYIDASGYGASTTADATTNTTALNNAASAAQSLGANTAVYIPPGAYDINGTIIFTTHVEASAATLNYYGTGRAVQVGYTSGTVMTDKTVRLPRVICKSAPAGGWDGTSEGVVVLSTNQCRIWVPRVETFEKGLLVSANGTAGTAYCDFYLGSLWVNHENLVLDQGNDPVVGWINQNSFYGGRITHSTSRGIPDDPIACHLRLGNRNNFPANNVPDGNSFYGLSMEGVNDGTGGWARYRIFCFGKYNQFFNCRFETTGAGVPVIRSEGLASNNIIHGGYHSWKLVQSGLVAFDIRDGVEGRLDAVNTSGQVLGTGDNATIVGWTNNTISKVAYNPATGEFTPTPGRWRIKARVTYAQNTTGTRTTRLYQGSTVIDQAVTPAQSTNSALSVLVEATARFNGNQTFKVNAQQTSGADLALSASSPYVNLQADYLGA